MTSEQRADSYSSMMSAKMREAAGDDQEVVYLYFVAMIDAKVHIMMIVGCCTSN